MDHTVVLDGLKAMLGALIWLYYIASLPIHLILFKDQGERYTSLWKFIIGCLLTIAALGASDVTSLLDLIVLLYILCASGMYLFKNRRRISKEKSLGSWPHSYSIGSPRFFPNTNWGFYLSAALPLIFSPIFLYFKSENTADYGILASIFLIFQVFFVLRKEKIQMLDQQDALAKARDLEPTLNKARILRSQANATQEQLIQLLKKK